MKVLFAGPDPDLVMRNTGDDRKEGLHLSDITKRMAFEKDKKLNPNSPIDAMVLERGFNWESILERALSDRHERNGHRPEQFQEDGVWMSPDWVDPDADVQLEEWKATKKTSKRGFDDVGWHWLPNTMAYLRGLLRRKVARVLRARFRIWFINGDYSYESKNSDLHLLNEYWKVDVEFDKRDLEENWRQILQAGRKYGLLKSEPNEEPCPSPKLVKKPVRKSVSNPPASSRGKVLIGTFPTTKKS